MLIGHIFVNVSFHFKIHNHNKKLCNVLAIIRFLDKDDAAKIRESFAGLWSLDDLDAIKAAMEQPDLFVLKPQREGGGLHHNS